MKTTTKLRIKLRISRQKKNCKKDVERTQITFIIFATERLFSCS